MHMQLYKVGEPSWEFQSEAHLWIQPQWPEDKMASLLDGLLHGNRVHIAFVNTLNSKAIYKLLKLFLNINIAAFVSVL